ncbi:major facilitator superfamily domain-containing protein [Penicillium chermesinum]|uniref:Major facilitator superfamily domain-containing protein n=1 Tax=Penicillium chermesinum TaxID=63820 RepID=A0A9W9NCK6_9EURO|nr:major facilitator superfamily domain-containing protein [Penicillium chermesinum]KAJ5217392.1 major facilitator superfamily domain-containing protein [Penicillium chermesinum]
MRGDGKASSMKDNQEYFDAEKDVPQTGASTESSQLDGPFAGPQGAQYAPRTHKFWLIMCCNFLTLFLVALDRTIISTAIPRITDEFNSLGDIGWYSSAYMLTGACSQPVFGRIYKFYDMKRNFLTAVIIFDIGSAVCGAVPTSNTFIAGRAIAGFASAGIFSGCMLITIPLVPLHKRPMFQSMFGAVFGIPSVLGPLVGGAFTSNVTWRWCFYINLPIGAVSWASMALVWYPEKIARNPIPIGQHIRRLDPLGMLFFASSMVCLLLALQWGGTTYSWKDGRIIALFVVFGVLFLAFAIVQVLTPGTATIPARVVTQRSIFCGSFYIFFIASSMMTIIYYIPIWCKTPAQTEQVPMLNSETVQTVKLVNPVDSGVYTLPLVLSLTVGSFCGGGITQKIGYYVPMMYACPAIMSIGVGLMSTFNVDTGSSLWIGYQFLSGFDLGLGMQITGILVQRVLPGPDIPIGISLMFLLQQLGGSIFTVVSQSILNNILVSRLVGIPGLDTGQVINEGATHLESVVPHAYIGMVKEVYNYALTRIFLMSMGLPLAALISSLGTEWMSLKKGKNGQDGPEASTRTGVASEYSESGQVST